MEKRSSEIRRMFGRIAHRYDLLNRVLSLGQDVRWRRLVARRVAEVEPARVLDVCSGTGDIALGLNPGPCVIGADFSLPMLALARAKAAERRRALQLVAVGRGAYAVVVRGVGEVHGYRQFSGLVAELERQLAAGNRLHRIAAHGRYNAGTVELTAPRAGFEFIAP